MLAPRTLTNLNILGCLAGLALGTQLQLNKPEGVELSARWVVFAFLFFAAAVLLVGLLEKLAVKMIKRPVSTAKEGEAPSHRVLFFTLAGRFYACLGLGLVAQSFWNPKLSVLTGVEFVSAGLGLLVGLWAREKWLFGKARA